MFWCKANAGVSISVNDDTIDLKSGFKQGLKSLFNENCQNAITFCRGLFFTNLHGRNNQITSYA